MGEYFAIAAVAENGVIGSGLHIPWRISDEFKHFKATTMGGVVVMGRRTWESLGGKPLPGRENVVVTSNASGVEGATVVGSLEELRRRFDGDPRKIWICGGAKLYKEALGMCSQLYLSRVKMKPLGDVFFPDFSGRFKLDKILIDHPQFRVEHWVAEGENPR